MNRNPKRGKALGLQETVTCPHCWHGFAPEEVLWVSRHPDLGGDPRLGSDANRRFLPTRFAPNGQALDPRGEACQDLACPECHLKIPRALIEMCPLYVSILGAPASGKSYYLGTMTWKLREMLRTRFLLGFEDADPEANEVLGGYESMLFLNENMDDPVTIRKTEPEGELYQRIRFGEHEKLFPKPFVFAVRPLEDHPRYESRGQDARALCVYDNAGEHFLPGADVSNQPGTRHLALSEALLFLFDPTQHPRMRAKCQAVSNDPQLGGQHVKTYRQDYVLLEAAKRIRSYSGLSQTEKYSKPLIVIVAKYDIWKFLLPDLQLDTLNVVRSLDGGIRAIDMKIVEHVSRRTRDLLSTVAPEFVNAAASFAKEVVYIPASAIGGSPEVISSTEAGRERDDTGTPAAPAPSQRGLGVRPKAIRPIWVEVPIAYVLARATKGLIRTGKSTVSPTPTHSPDD